MERRKHAYIYIHTQSGFFPPPLPAFVHKPTLSLSLSARIFMYVFLSGLGLLVVVGLHQLLESRKVQIPSDETVFKEMGS